MVPCLPTTRYAVKGVIVIVLRTYFFIKFHKENHQTGFKRDARVFRICQDRKPKVS